MSKLHIVGAGAIGSLVAAGAHRANMVCTRYPRTLDTAPSIARWLDGTQFPLPPAQSSLEVLGEDDVLLLPLKTIRPPPCFILSVRLSPNASTSCCGSSFDIRIVGFIASYRVSMM